MHWFWKKLLLHMISEKSFIDCFLSLTIKFHFKIVDCKFSEWQSKKEWENKKLTWLCEKIFIFIFTINVISMYNFQGIISYEIPLCRHVQTEILNHIWLTTLCLLISHEVSQVCTWNELFPFLLLGVQQDGVVGLLKHRCLSLHPH